MRGDEIRFGELSEDGNYSFIRTIKNSDIAACKFVIMVPEHYREDGSCKCDDPEHRAMMIKEWGYKEDDFIGISLRNS